MSRMIGIGLVAALAACSGKTNNNGGETACQVTADCAADQSCEDGVCVDLGGDACTVTADCPAGETCEAGVCTPAPLPDLRVSFIDSVIRDERGDQVDLSGDAPKHTHAGDPITLNGEGCPEVHKYAYLADPDAPLFGTEDIANPIAWRFNVDGAAVIARADYRVRTATTTLLDWTETTADLAGTFPVEVFRSGGHPVPELGAIAQQYFIDFRVKDDRDREATVTGCWDHHPIAAPVKFTGLAQTFEADAVSVFFTLPANKPISRVVSGTDTVKVFAARVINPTAEDTMVQFDLPIPTGTFTRLAVVDRVSQRTTQASVDCGFTCTRSGCNNQPATDPRCKTSNVTDPADSVTNGILEPGNWAVRVIDTSTFNQASQCTVSGLRATCVLAGRQPAGAPKQLIVELSTSAHRELAPAAFGTIGEFSLQGLTYTGLAIDQNDNLFKCDDPEDFPDSDLGIIEHKCLAFTTFFKLVALDSLRVTFDAPTMKVKTAIAPVAALPGTDFALPNDRPNGLVTGTGFTWDAGNDDLPGTAH